MSEKVKIALIGAGSIIFGPRTMGDLMLSDRLNEKELEICLMDISEEALKVSSRYCEEIQKLAGRNARIISTTSLEKALEETSYVITAIEVERYHYWFQDFHIPRKYGSVQIYGENGGAGAVFHTLRNIPPMLEIARMMERKCPQAWLINYTNPESKLVEALSRLTKIKVIGLCHGFDGGLDQVSQVLEIPKEQIRFKAYGLNHFGWFGMLQDKETGEDLYPKLKKREKEGNYLADWDDLALVRLMFRTYGLWPYPGTNHVGEYIRWAKDYLASDKLQFFYDPAKEDPTTDGTTPVFVYSLTANPTNFKLYDKVEQTLYPDFEQAFLVGEDGLHPSGEKAVEIIEALEFDISTEIPSVNITNKGSIPGLPEDMVVEVPAIVDGSGVHPERMEPLPEAVTAMIRQQGAIQKLIVEAYLEKSRNKLLQALLLDPTSPGYSNCVHMINEFFKVQKDILPRLEWKDE